MVITQQTDGNVCGPISTAYGLELSNIYFKHSGAASPLFEGLSLRIEPGEIVAVLGASGVGKSTLIRLCLGFSPPGSHILGGLHYNNINLLANSELEWRALRGKTLGWMHQAVATAFEPHARIESQLGDVLRHLCGLSMQDSRNRLLQALTSLGLAAIKSHSCLPHSNTINIAPPQNTLHPSHSCGAEHPKTLLTRYWNELSGGQKRLVFFALWHVIRPDFLFLDEPTAGLDSTYSANLAAMLRSEYTQHGRSMLVVSHDRCFAQMIADRCLMLSQGNLVPFSQYGFEDKFFIPPEPEVWGTGVLKSPYGIDQMQEQILRQPARSVDKKTHSGSSLVDEIILDVSELTKSFLPSKPNLPLFDKVAFRVWRGSVSVLCGRSGSGKTTAVNCALRLCEPDGGSVIFKNINILNLDAASLRQLRRHMQIVEQDAHGTIDPLWTVRKVLSESARLYPLEHDELEYRMALWMQALALPVEYLNRQSRQLSIGEAQRVAIARALVMEPELLVLDEPTSNLDHISCEHLVQCICLYLSKVKSGILLITHDHSLVQKLGTHATLHLYRKFPSCTHERWSPSLGRLSKLS